MESTLNVNWMVKVGSRLLFPWHFIGFAVLLDAFFIMIFRRRPRVTICRTPFLISLI